MIYNSTPGAFPWYEKKEQQNRYRENCEADCDMALISPKNALLPWQWYRPRTPRPILGWIIENVTTGATFDLAPSIATKIKARTMEGNDYFYYDGSALTVKPATGPNVPLNLPTGFYQSVLLFGGVGNNRTSEMFFIPPNDAFNVEDININYLKLTWSNPCNILPFYYEDQVFKNVVYLDTMITASEPELSQDATKDGDDNDIPTFQKTVIPYYINLFVPDFLKVALFVIQMHKNVTLVSKNGINTANLKYIKVDSQVDVPGCKSTVKITFQQDIAIILGSCCDNLVAQGCPGPAAVLNGVGYADGFITIAGTADPNTWINVYGAMVEAGPYSLVASNIEYSALQSGVNQIPAMGYSWFKIEAKNFNCTYALSNASQIATFTNVRTQTFTGSCPAGQHDSTPTPFTRTYVSQISQADADNMRAADNAQYLADGQAQADANATCVPNAVYSYDRVQSFTRNNCAPGYAGTSVNFSKNYTSTISLADAMAQAAADPNYTTQGQAFANDPANGAVCNALPTFSATRTQNFTRNNCGAGFTGGTVSFSKTFTSTVSQADADNKAATDPDYNTDGQAYANNPANGAACTPETEYTATRSEDFTKNDCEEPLLGTVVPFTKTYTSTISQADADNQAATDPDFDTEGQAYANTNGDCFDDGGGSDLVSLSAPGVASATIKTSGGGTVAVLSVGAGGGGDSDTILGGTFTVLVSATSGTGNFSASISAANGSFGDTASSGGTIPFTGVQSPFDISVSEV